MCALLVVEDIMVEDEEDEKKNCWKKDGKENTFQTHLKGTRDSIYMCIVRW